MWKVPSKRSDPPFFSLLLHNQSSHSCGQYLGNYIRILRALNESWLVSDGPHGGVVSPIESSFLPRSRNGLCRWIGDCNTACMCCCEWWTGQLSRMYQSYVCMSAEIDGWIHVCAYDFCFFPGVHPDSEDGFRFPEALHWSQTLADTHSLSLQNILQSILLWFHLSCASFSLPTAEHTKPRDPLMWDLPPPPWGGPVPQLRKLVYTVARRWHKLKPLRWEINTSTVWWAFLAALSVNCSLNDSRSAISTSGQICAVMTASVSFAPNKHFSTQACRSTLQTTWSHAGFFFFTVKP